MAALAEALQKAAGAPAGEQCDVLLEGFAEEERAGMKAALADLSSQARSQLAQVAQEAVEEDAPGDCALAGVLGESLLKSDGSKVDTSVALSKCKVVNGGAGSVGSRQFEVVVCSMDRDEQGFRGSFPADAPWLAIDFGSKFREDVLSKFSPPGVPTLTILSLSGGMLVQEGDGEMVDGAFERWVGLA